MTDKTLKLKTSDAGFIRLPMIKRQMFSNRSKSQYIIIFIDDQRFNCGHTTFACNPIWINVCTIRADSSGLVPFQFGLHMWEALLELKSEMGLHLYTIMFEWSYSKIEFELSKKKS